MNVLLAMATASLHTHIPLCHSPSKAVETDNGKAIPYVLITYDLINTLLPATKIFR